jgi:hypothetical protein
MEWFYATNLSDQFSVVPEHINELPIARIDQIDEPMEGGYDKLFETAASFVDSGDLSADDILGRCTDALNESNDRVIHDVLSELAQRLTENHNRHVNLNLNLIDYIEPYEDGPQLADFGSCQPAEGVGQTVLSTTSTDYDGLRIDSIECESQPDGSMLILAVARYKPEDESEPTDRNGYLTTSPLPALTLSGLSDTEAKLVKYFLPVAADQAGGFANFREKATKTISLVDRLENLVLPKVADVSEDIDRFATTMDEASNVEAKIERADYLINNIVYALYGLDEAEIELVEEHPRTG